MIIGISGKKQSGKNTVANIWQYLYDYHNNNYKHPINVNDLNSYLKNSHNLKCEWEQKSFAEKIKKMICLLLNCTMTDLEDPIFKETELGEEWWVIKLPSSGIIPYLGDYSPFYRKYDVIKLTPRLLLQLLGTDCGRKIIHPDIWVNSLMNEYNPVDRRTIQDPDDSNINFPNWIITDVRFPNEAEAIKIHTNKLIRVVRTFEHEDNHFSETALDHYDDWDYVINNDGSIDNLIFKVKEIMIKEKIL